MYCIQNENEQWITKRYTSFALYWGIWKSKVRLYTCTCHYNKHIVVKSQTCNNDGMVVQPVALPPHCFRVPNSIQTHHKYHKQYHRWHFIGGWYTYSVLILVLPPPQPPPQPFNQFLCFWMPPWKMAWSKPALQSNLISLLGINLQMLWPLNNHWWKIRFRLNKKRIAVHVKHSQNLPIVTHQCK